MGVGIWGGVVSDGGGEEMVVEVEVEVEVELRRAVWLVVCLYLVAVSVPLYVGFEVVAFLFFSC